MFTIVWEEGVNGEEKKKGKIHKGTKEEIIIKWNKNLRGH